MELRQLEYFVSVVEAGSFSRAAVALNLAQPSVSRQIALLEQEVGQRLLERTGRGVVLTEGGELLLVHARSMLETAQRARAELHELGTNPSGRVVVGLPPRVALGLSVPLIKRFRARFPNAVITVLEGLSLSLRESLIGGRIDVALLFDPAPTPLLHCETLQRESMVLVAPQGSKLPACVSLARLADYPMILPSAPNAIRSIVHAALRPRKIELEVVAEVGAVHTVLTLVAQGAGCTIVPTSAMHLTREAARLPTAAIGPPEITNTLVLATPVARPANRLARATAQLLRELDFRSMSA
ncbi:MAG: LysR substrate-binding domain-containing protein [Burkholderiaceae bacterium]|nr:LysR family transcriptional regulator [Rhodoferax sp.]MCB2005433.1 LysR family transcriptional regulator [Rhodoferax sp.]MCB2043765.1 LysR family transcriptional regulator [Rhodoferax sp.]MCW5645576.1 LysR family transcriptional regulator [Rhodoferax sp.]